jgi:hypothetical protein
MGGDACVAPARASTLGKTHTTGKNHCPITYDPADEKKRILATTKNNLCEPANNLSYQVVQNDSGIPYTEWLGEIDLDISTLIGTGINLSFPRQEIIKVLQDSKNLPQI